MKQMWVRPITEADLPKLSEWMHSTPDNLFDKDVLRYPETTTLCAHSGEPVMYLPVQAAAVLESIARKPDATPLEVAEALKQLLKVIVTLCSMRGIHEVYFLCKDENVVNLAKRHGFEEMPWKTLRMKIDKLGQEDNGKSLHADPLG